MNQDHDALLNSLYKTRIGDDDDNDSSDEIVIDNESDIVQLDTDELIQPNYIMNEPQHFVFPSSPNNRSFCGGCGHRATDYFRPIAPQISARSLQHNLIALTSRHNVSVSNKLIKNINVERDNFNDSAESELMSMWSAGFIIINFYLGLGLLSYPYALKNGGFISFIILFIICIFMSWTGKLLVRCFNRMRPSKKTYTDVGYKSFGKYGSFLISFGIIFEFFGTICMNMIFMWDNTKYFIDSANFIPNNIGNTFNIALICSISILPTCWILNLSQLSFVSFLGCICKILTVFVIIICFFLNLDSVKYNISSSNPSDKLLKYPKDLQSLSICIGIFILSFAGHPVLPAIYTSMKEPERFEVLLDRCFICLFVIYSIMAFSGYLQFADDTNVIIIENLMNNNNESSNPSQMFMSQILVMFIIFGLYFQASPILSLLSEIPEMIIFDKVLKNKWMKRLFRTILFIICVIISYIIRNHLAILEASTGSLCTMITSVICPSLFYFAIYRNYTNHNKRVVLIFTACLGVLFAFFLLFNDIKSLI